METDRDRQKRRRIQLASTIGVIVIFGIGAVLRSSDRSAGTVVLEIGAALVVVAVILLVVRRYLGSNSDVLGTLRKTEPVSYACYFENGKRGTVSVVNGELIVRRFKRKSLLDDLRVPAGTWTISPAKVQLTAARQAEGMIVSDASSEPVAGGIRIALSQDTMTLLGNMLKGPELDHAMSLLRDGGYGATTTPDPDPRPMP